MSEVIQKQRNQSLNIQKQSFKDVLKKRCSEICSKFTAEEHLWRSVIYMWMESNFIEITLLHGCFPVNLLHIFRTASHEITSRGLLLNIVTNNTEKGDRKIQCNQNYV